MTFSEIKCPFCGSKRIWRDGIYYSKSGGEIQRYFCRSCGRRFSEATLKNSDSDEKSQKRLGQLLFSSSATSAGCRVGGWEGQPKNSASKKLGKKTMTLTKEAKMSAALSKRPTPQEVREKIVEYSWWLHKQGYAESTIISRTKLLQRLVKLGANLFDPESVKETIAKQKNWSNGRKANAVDAYTSFLVILGMSWDPPRYKRIRKLPFIPTESELDQLIAGCGFKTGTFLLLLKETGMRAGEAINLTWNDVDFIAKTVRVTPEKGSEPRIFKISDTLIERLKALPKDSDKVFGRTKLKTMHRMYVDQRKRIAAKTKNPRLQRITFHTFRHWKATMEYHKTKDILHVMKLLGHKNISNTLVYTQLVDFGEEEYVTKVAWTLDEACKLVEAGFEYVCEMEGAKIFRKRK